MPTSPYGTDPWPYAPELEPFAYGIAVLLQHRGHLKQLNFVLAALTAHVAAHNRRPPGSLAQTIRKFVNGSFPLDPTPPDTVAMEGPLVERIYAHLASSPKPVVAAVCMYYLDGPDLDQIMKRTGVGKAELQAALKDLTQKCSGLAA